MCNVYYTVYSPQKTYSTSTTSIMQVSGVIMRYVTNSIQQSPSCESNTSSSTQETPRILYKPEGSSPHSQPPANSPCPETDPVNAPHSTSAKSIFILSFHLHLDLPSDLLPSGFPIEIQYAHLLSPIPATRPAHLNYYVIHLKNCKIFHNMYYWQKYYILGVKPLTFNQI